MQIAITTYNRPIVLGRCLTSIRKFHKDVSIIIFDDNSETELSKESLDMFNIKEYIKSDKNMGSNCNNQRALEYFNENKTPKWILLDDDIKFNAPFIETVEKELDNGIEHLYARTKRPDRIQFIGTFMSGTQKLLDTIGGFNLEKFPSYGGAHVDWQYRAYNNGLAKEIKLDFELQETATANKERRRAFKNTKKSWSFNDLAKINNKSKIPFKGK